MAYYLESTDEVLKKLSSTENGLTSAEAEARLEKHGKNKLDEGEKDTILKKLLRSLADPMIIMLLAAAGISAVTTLIEKKGAATLEDWADLVIILIVVVINSVLSVVQESKAEQAIDALAKMTAATSKVLRDGEMIVVKSEDLTIGDVVVLEAGDAVPADCRILEGHSLKAEESALTGESVPVNKLIDVIMLKEGEEHVPLGDRKNMLYSGSTVVYGRGKAVITDIGMQTEMGKIATALATAEQEKTPLQIKMAELSSVLTKLVIGISLFVFLFGIGRNLIVNGGVPDLGAFGMEVLDTFTLAVALAVAAIPEGLTAVVTIILSIGVTSMSKRRALIRKMTAVETLGCTQIICSDKTGTLTQNKMTVVDKFTADELLLAKAMSLCSDAVIKSGDTQATGEPTECALVNYASAVGTPKADLEAVAPRVGEAPFDSMRKMMSTIHRQDGKFVQYTKGACEMLMGRCVGYLTENGVVPMTKELIDAVAVQNKNFADRALRVLGAAYRVYDAMPESLEPDALEQELIFIGFVGMIDPCRPEVYEAIKQCRSAGIRPIMITGDHKDTAIAIGKDLGIIEDASQAIVGAELEKYTDEQLVEMVPQYSVYARVQPEHKTRIVRAWKARGMVTAMTGDGVNDAPSIKASDIGIGMGITGTDVTKGVADMVLADDNFATIVSAVEEGRKIYDNVRKVLQFQLSTNAAEVLTIFIAFLMGFNIFSPAHLLWINMVTDSTPGLALGMEKAEGNLMKRQPRDSKEGIFAGGAGVDIIVQGAIMAALILASYFIGGMLEHQLHPELAGKDLEEAKAAAGTSMAFLTINFVEIFRAFASRSTTHSIFVMKTQNYWLWGAFLLTALLTCGVIYIPFMADLFGISPIAPVEFATAFGLAFLIIPIVEIYKLIKRLVMKSKAN